MSNNDSFFCARLISIAVADRDASRAFFLRSMERLKAQLARFLATLAKLSASEIVTACNFAQQQTRFYRLC